MPAEMELAGVPELLDALNLLMNKPSEVIDDALKAAAQPVLDDAKRTTAFHDRNKIKSKRLRERLRVSNVKIDKKYKYKYVRVLTDAPHAHLVEFGHSGDYAPPHPFLQPALERHKNEVVEIIANKLREALNGI